MQSAKSITVNSKLSSSESFDRSESSTIDKQATLITRSRELTITSTRNIDLIFRNVFSQKIVDESTFTTQAFVDMTHNARNAEFEADNIEQDEFSSFNQISDVSLNQFSDDQITNHSIKSIDFTSDSMFSQAQRMKIADIVVAVLRMNRQNNSSEIFFSSVSSITSMTSIFETRSDR